MIRDATPHDAAVISKIYNHYVTDTIITFEIDPLEESTMAERIADTMKTYPWYVYEEAGEVLGYAYASQWKSRCAYLHSVESTVYLKPNVLGKGIGSQLYAKLIDELKRSQTHAIIAGIALPNDASVALQEKFGFEKVAHFKQVGYKFEQWIDVGYWQLLL